MTLFLSHRGESDDAPENTIEAFRLAMKRNSDGIELDIRLTADGEAVCVHDETLERVAGVPLSVRNSTLAELRRHWPVPLLSEALAELHPGKTMQIELKGSPEVALPLKQVLEQWNGDPRNLTLSSFETETVRRTVELFPDLSRVLLIDLERKFGTFPNAEAVAGYLSEFPCGVSFRATEAATAEFAEELHRRGVKVVCWGVSSDELGLKMAGIGVDALTCNHAVELRRQWLERHL